MTWLKSFQKEGLEIGRGWGRGEVGIQDWMPLSGGFLLIDWAVEAEHFES